MKKNSIVFGAGPGRVTRILVLFCLGFGCDTLAGVQGPLPRSKGMLDAGNRLTYLDSSDPYYPHLSFPKLTTPQWLGERGAQAAVILSIDDLGEVDKYERFLRPILNALKDIDGRASLSITVNRVDPNDPHLQKWLEEGVSLETHTTKHLCPMMQGGELETIKADYDQCVELLYSIPNNRPVAFRVPCCDSMNAVSPRFFAEVFNKTTPGGRFITIDSSVFNLTTSNDPDLPRDLVIDPDGRDKFLKYVPERSKYVERFVNTIENYPYPYVIGRLCWEFPCAMPSDWDAQNLHQPNNPYTIEDWLAAVDAAVAKKGVFTLVFHPHGWVENTQIADLARAVHHRHGSKVIFLNFKEAEERLRENLLDGHSIRAANGQDNGVRIIDLNNDGFLDVLIGNDEARITKLWQPTIGEWGRTSCPTQFVYTDQHGNRIDAGVRFGVLTEDGHASMIVQTKNSSGAWTFDGSQWIESPELLNGLDGEDGPSLTAGDHGDTGFRCRDLDKDGRCEILVSNDSQNVILAWDKVERSWIKAPIQFPPQTRIVDKNGDDAGLRFVDVNEDGFDDVVFSNEKRYSLHLFESMETGWSIEVLAGNRGDGDALPMITRNGTNNGAWIHSRSLWVQNEDTAKMKDHVDSRSFNDLLEATDPPPKSPKASLNAIQTRPGFEVELVAAEPMVMDPISLDWGPDGKLWVVEMADYPEGIDNSWKPGGRVRFLEDTDADGAYDRSVIFLDELPFPTSVMPWREGVLITAAPDLFYAEDTNGDGKADKKEVLYTGFGSWNQQHLVNGLRYGLDNWVYCANGDSGGQIESTKTADSVNIRGRDFRIRPDEGRIDAQAGQTQFGRCQDDWGNWFGCSNPNPMWHFVLEDHYIRRNPHLAPPDYRKDVSIVPGPSPNFPISRTLARVNDPWMVNRFTSCCGVTIHRDELFGPLFQGNSFVCEPVHNLVHREIMKSDGVTFTSRRPPDELESEFLASSDNWFRPTTVRTGPDGALWVTDMYRAWIEHPKFIPAELQEGVDFRAGEDRGRIYRVYPVGAKPRPIRRLDNLPTPELVQTLNSPNGRWRDMAQQLLIHRADKSAVPALEELVHHGERPTSRLHALCALDGLETLNIEIVQKALADPHPGVRRHAVRLCKDFFEEHPSLGETLAYLVEDSDPLVRLQLAYTLGEWDSSASGRILGNLILQEQGNEYLLAACLSSLNQENLSLFISQAFSGAGPDPPSEDMVSVLTRIAVGMNDHPSIALLLQETASPLEGGYDLWQATAFAGFLEALSDEGETLSEYLKKHGEELDVPHEFFSDLFETARNTLQAPTTEVETKIASIKLLGYQEGREREDIKGLVELLIPQTDAEIRETAASALKRIDSPLALEDLLGGWKARSQEIRAEIIEILLFRDAWALALLEKMHTEPAIRRDVDAYHRQRLLYHNLEPVRNKAQEVFADITNPDRKRLIEEYQVVKDLVGDSERGRTVFEERCGVCHALGGIGRAIGPDLAALTDKSDDALLVAVLDPNQSVEMKYHSFMVETSDGISYSGLLTNETGNSLTLTEVDGNEAIFLRDDIESMQESTLSFMPEGLEADLSPQDLADLFAFIRGTRPKPKTFEGNQPVVVQRELFRGEIWLMAPQSEVYGDTLVFDNRSQSLTQWNSDNDFVAWEFEVVDPGVYQIVMDYSSDNEGSGNEFMIESAGQKVVGEVEETGNSEIFRQRRVGKIRLEEGRNRLVIRPNGTPEGRLFNLKSIALQPRGEF